MEIRVEKMLRRNEEDHLSHLPEVDILEVFKHLSRTDIYHLRLTNKRLHKITYDRTLRHIKWNCGKLYIYQTENSFCFKMKAAVDCPFVKHSNGQGSYKYEIKKVSRIAKKSIDESEEPHEEWSRAFHQELIIPFDFFIALSEVLRFRVPDLIRIERIPMDTHFLDNLEWAMKGQSIQRVALWNIFFDQNVEETMKGLARLASALNTFIVAGTHTISPITEAFIEDIAKSNSLCNLFWSGPTASENYNRGFHASKAIVNHLIRFKNLDLPMVKISAEWAVELFMLHMDTITNPSAHSWRFQIDRPITEFYDRLEDYEIYSDDESSLLIRKRDGYTARIDMQDYCMNHFRTHTISFVINVEFFCNSEHIP